jgi:flagellin
MRINHNISAMNTNRQMAINNTATSKSMEKLSSGLRINRAADDAAGLSISEKMRGQIRALNQASSNAEDGVSLIQTAEGALNEVSDMLVRMKELKVQASNGTYDSATDVANINLELDALGSAIDKVLSDTSFNGIKMLDSAFTGVNITDTAGATSVSIAKITFAGGLSNTSTIADLDTAINNVNSDRAKYGAQQNQLEHTINNLNTTAENLSASESRIRDVDMAKEMMEFTKNNILLQASEAMLAQANSQPQGVLQLLR